jgi:hypothetical protein
MNENAKTVQETLSLCKTICLDRAEELKVLHRFREADGAMSCYLKIKELILNDGKNAYNM